MPVPLLLALIAAVSVPPPPPVDIQGNARERPLVTWMPGEMRCEGVAVAPALLRRPAVSLGWAGMPVAGPVTYRFAIDAAGRTLSIAAPEGGNASYGEDIAPSLAATRFPAGAARQGCAVTYTQTPVPLDAAPREDLISYTLDQRSGPLPPAGWDRITPPGATCNAEPRAQSLVQLLPDFRAMPATPGTRDWTMVAYDIDAKGRPVRVRTETGTRNAVLDAEGVKAMKRSRFTGGARTGCLYPYYRSPAAMPAPPMPDADPEPLPGSTCPKGIGWVTPPRLTYPEPFRRRGIEGWAIVAFDLAPWGEPGNIRILAAEPAAAFGDQARQVIASSRKPAAGTGAVGCVDRVVFRMAQTMGLGGASIPPAD